MEKFMKNKLDRQIEEDALLREVVDDVKNDQFRQMWDKYGLFIIIGVALVLTFTISFESIKNWQNKKYQEVSNAYSVALSLQNQENSAKNNNSTPWLFPMIAQCRLFSPRRSL